MEDIHKTLEEILVELRILTTIAQDKQEAENEQAEHDTNLRELITADFNKTHIL